MASRRRGNAGEPTRTFAEIVAEVKAAPIVAAVDVYWADVQPP